MCVWGGGVWGVWGGQNQLVSPTLLKVGGQVPPALPPSPTPLNVNESTQQRRLVVSNKRKPHFFITNSSILVEWLSNNQKQANLGKFQARFLNFFMQFCIDKKTNNANFILTSKARKSNQRIV